MTSIFDCAEYTRNGTRGVPYFPDNARYGRPGDTIVFYYAYTRTGRVSKFWCAHQMHYALRNKQALHREYLRTERPALRGRLRGYKWSKAYLYSGNLDDWKDWQG